MQVDGLARKIFNQCSENCLNRKEFSIQLNGLVVWEMIEIKSTIFFFFLPQIVYGKGGREMEIEHGHSM